MFRSLILAAVLLASAPLVANAGEITLLPSIKLQIGDRDNYGNYWDGGGWRDRDYWRRHYGGAITAGVVTTTAGIAAGIKVKPTNAAIAKAGKIAMTDAAAGGVGQAADADMATGIINRKGPFGSFFHRHA